MPIFWQCDRCTACCRWPGEVRVSEEQMNQIAGHLGISVAAFIRDYTRLTVQRDGLALTDQTDGSCVFLDGQDCRIQAVKPQQCRDFPNLWNFPGFEEICRAKPLNVPADQWRERIRIATGKSVDPFDVSPS